MNKKKPEMEHDKKNRLTMQCSRNRLLLCTFLLLTAYAAVADNYFTIGVNDTLRVNPDYIGGIMPVPVYAHFDGRLDGWYLSMNYPAADTMEVTGASEGPGMSVPYLDSIGQPQIFQAVLTAPTDFSYITSHIQIIGYWDYNHSGNYAPYGTVKWEAGDYHMFTLLFDVKQSCHQGNIIIDGILTSNGDARGGIIGYYVTFRRKIHLIVGYMRGDINGDEIINLGDMNLLISYLLYGGTLDYYQMQAADITGDGNVNTGDLSALINLLNAS